MLEPYEKYLPMAIKLIALITGLTLFYYFGSLIISAILPFLVAWGIAVFIEPLINLLKRKLKISHTLSILISLTVFIGAILLIVSIIGGLIVIETMKIYATLSDFTNNFYGELSKTVEEIQNYYNLLPPNVTQSILSSLNSLADKIVSYISIILTSILGLMTFVPETFIFLIVTFIAAFFFARDKKTIQDFVLKNIKPSWKIKVQAVKQDLLLALLGYIKAQLILMSVTFTVSSIGLYIIGIEYAIVIALIASLLDALPILGTSGVFIPMVLWNVFKGDYSLALYLGIVYVCALTVRQLLEPKVLGNQIGLHPLVTLMSMYVGLKVFGVFGLIFGPVALVIGLAFYKVETTTKTMEKNIQSDTN